jgi:hypothetical protein
MAVAGNSGHTAATELRRLDALLEVLEELLLHDVCRLPEPQRREVAGAMLAAGRVGAPPERTADAHGLILDLQARPLLMVVARRRWW